MKTPEVRDGQPSRGIQMPRWVALLLGLFVALVIYPFIVGVLPWAISLITPRYGWTENAPASWNMLGLVPVVAGAAGLIWVFSVMLAQIPKLPQTVELDSEEHLWLATSKVLVTHGPFAFSRNPMFLSGVTVLLGWALFYGSPVILVLAVIGWTMANLFKVPQEERALEAHFGEAYRDYLRRVPRWFGKRR